MSVKNELRKKLKEKRRLYHNELLDKKVCENLIDFDLYKNAETVLFYASLQDEICVDSVIENAFKAGKKVALPVCSDNNGNMDFYYIKSMNDLKLGFFSVREPDTEKCELCIDFDNSICVVPAISFDEKGYRLGYGKGYYDRFLKKFTSFSVGMCYNELIEEKIPNDDYDIPVDFIITQDKLISVISEEENNGK